MLDINLARGLLLMAIALVFGIGATQYQIGTFSRSGPGLFPLVISALLFLIGLTMALRSFFTAREPLDYNAKNIFLVLAGMCGFALLSRHLNMVVGTVFLVVCVSFADKTRSNWRSLKITAVLLLIAFQFRNFLGLQLPLL